MDRIAFVFQSAARMAGSRFFLTGVFALLTVSLLLGACSGAEKPAFEGGPRLSVDPPEWDFGTVNAGTTVKPVFTLKNIGDAALVIEKAPVRLVEGCCPPSTQLSAQELKPGKNGTVSMEFTMTGDMVGPHKFELLVYSNDAVSPVTKVEIRGTYLSEQPGN